MQNADFSSMSHNISTMITKNQVLYQQNNMKATEEMEKNSAANRTHMQVIAHRQIENLFFNSTGILKKKKHHFF